ncbi:MAG: FAD-dependent oxidoreductase [Deltaproteobacteria bacterium]|nr:FAD-dependent oxidoreductase [Deltaproteobacteria bacterium]
MLPERVETLVIGGGVVGLTVARELALRGRRDVLVVEREAELGRHASGRNSGVLHAGIYYAPESQKARTCLAGNRLMRAFCREKGLSLSEAGKVIVAREEAELPVLDELYSRATRNGARVEWLDEKQLAEVEPRARTRQKAIWSRDTAVVDPLEVLQALRADLEDRGVRVVTGRAFLGRAGPGRALLTGGTVAYERLVNAAGAWCDLVARPFGLAEHYRLIPFKGIYRRLKPGASFDVRGNIYPVPDIRNPFLGVHFTRSAHGHLYLGPTAIPAFGRANYGLLSGTGGEALPLLLADATLFFRNPRFRNVALSEPKKYLPHYFHRDAARLVQGYSPELFEAATKVGIRPQLVDWRTKELVMDFVVEARDGAVHVLNPVSPAFTSSMEIARTIVAEHFA